MPKQLLSGESMVLPPIRRHWIWLVKELLVPAMVVAVVLTVIDVVGQGLVPSDIRVVLTLVVLTVLVLVAWWTWLNWSAASLTVTDQRVILEEGIVIRTSKVIPLDRVQDVSTRQNLFGRVLDYGSVEIDTAGSIPNELFSYVAGPEMLRDQVFVLSEQLRRGL